MEVILFQPQIPSNTGNIVRTCATVGAKLTLVRPLGFRTSSRELKRAGLDYWEGVTVQEIDDLEEYLKQSTKPFYLFSSKAEKPYFSAGFTESDTLVFGNETDGLPPHIFEKYKENFVTIPMVEKARCLNLSNAVAIGLFEARRQILNS